MRIIFFCDAAIKDGRLGCASWIDSIARRLPDDIELTVACDGSGEASGDFFIGERRVGMLRFSLGGSEDAAAREIGSLAPDAVVIFGTEKKYTLFAIGACNRAGVIDRTALFAQGLACACAEHYREGVPERVARRYTLRDLLRRSNIITEQRAVQRRAEGERKAVGQAKHFIGRTTLDRAVLESINRGTRYYHCSDMMRPAFYSGEWRFENCEPHRIFVSQYYYPLKGFHYLLRAAAQLKERYPDLRIAAAGYNPVKSSLTKNEPKDSSYIRYVKQLVRQLGLEDNIELLGELSEDEMKREYLRANVFVLPSTIENSPNSLGEAMLLGVPCVASDVGGVSDFAVHKRDAFIYPSNAPYLLAYYIDKLFGDPQLCHELGANARVSAEEEYDIARNSESFVRVLREIADFADKQMIKES